MSSESMILKNCMDSILKYRQQIYGLLAIWIVLFHVSNRVGVPLHPGIIEPLICMGNICVDVFMFLSGYCICRSYERKKSIFDFYRRRVFRVVIPYLVISIPLYLWKDGFETGWKFNLKGYIGDLSTYNFWMHGMQTTWFVCAIILFYLLVPAFYYLSKKKQNAGIILVIFGYTLNIFLSLTWEGYHQAKIAWARLPVFILGIVAYFHPQLTLNRNTIRLFITLSILFTVVFPIREWYTLIFGSHAEVLFLSYIFLVPGILFMLYKVISILPKGFKVFLAFVGGFSLEIYLIHVFLLRIFDFFHCVDVLKGFYYLIIPLLTLFLVYLYQTVRNVICKSFATYHY